MDEIAIYMQNHKPCVWNTRDWSALRKRRIVTCLSGTLANFPRDHVQNGLPAICLPEEINFLQQQNIRTSANMDDKTITRIRFCYYNTPTETISHRQINCLKDSMPGNSNAKTEGSSKECILMKLSDGAFSRIPNSDACDGSSSSNRLPCVSTGDGHLVNSSIFAELHEMGYFLTSGTKFGCDFLVYPGDPVKFHSIFMVFCMNRLDDWISAHELIWATRVSCTAKKTVVLSTINDENDNNVTSHRKNVIYQSLQWTQF